MTQLRHERYRPGAFELALVYHRRHRAMNISEVSYYTETYDEVKECILRTNSGVGALRYGLGLDIMRFKT